MIRFLWILFICASCESNIYKNQANIIQKLNPAIRIDMDKAEIGHLLFFESALSKNATKSCASCHNPDLYFTDGYKKSLGLYADILTKSCRR